MTTPPLFRDLVPVILAGGSGTRLWPASRSNYPKHLASLVGDRSLLQETAMRTAGMADDDHLIVVGAVNQGMLIHRQLASIVAPLGHRLMLEPSARNTAAAIGLAAHQALQSFGPDAIIFVCPSDHLILAMDAFRHAIETGMTAARQGKLVTFGIQPDRPETGFGYICQGQTLDNAPGVLRVDRFVEKPELQVAQAMLEDGNYAWNSGMFLMRAAAVLDELTRFEPELAAGVANAFLARDADTGIISPDLFALIKSMPIDKAVMERSEHVAVVPCDLKWSDLGSWHALWEILDKDADGNALQGDAMVVDGQNNVVKAGSRLVTLAGVSDLAVIETADAILVADRNKSDLIKTIVSQLTENARPEVDDHTIQPTAWGEQDEIRTKSDYSLHELRLDPNNTINLDELTPFDIGIVLAGTCTLLSKSGRETLQPRQSFTINPETKSISNQSDMPLKLLITKFSIC